MRHSEILAARWGSAPFLPRRRLSIPQAKAGQHEQPITGEFAEVRAKEREMRQDRAGYLFPARNVDKRVRSSGADGSAVSRCGNPGQARSRGDDAACRAPYGDHQAGAGRGRPSDHSADQRPQDGGDGPAILACQRPTYRRGDRRIGARRLRDYTKITPRLAAASRQYTGKSLKAFSKTLEAGSGIEPLYEDLQSSA